MDFITSPFLNGNDSSHAQQYGQFPDPFLDYASIIKPSQIKDVLRWAEFLWGQLGIWRMAGRRVIRYFLTTYELSGGSEGERTRYKEFLDGTLKVMSLLALIGDDFFAYGNSFSTLYVPFRRFLRCTTKNCGLERLSSRVDYTFKDLKFTAYCPSCKKITTHTHHDRRSLEQEKLRIIRWNPHDIKIHYHPLSQYAEYVWNIPADLSTKIKEGNKFYIETTPWEVIKTVHSEDRSFKFHDSIIYHMKEPTLAGIQNRGWGIPSVLYNFSQAYRVQILKRYDEALAMDYIVPFRCVTPKAGTGREEDPMKDVRLGEFSHHIMNMLREHRLDPTTWHSIPFPIEYQALGGEGKALAPTEQINQATDELLNESGYPAEMYKGTIQAQAAPTALRLFQQTWTHLVAFNNDWLDWLLSTIAINLNWERVTGRMQDVTMADDIENRNLQMQLAAGGMIARGTALSTIGLKYMDEVKKTMEEERETARLQEKMQKEEMERQEAQARMSGMGPSLGMSSGPATPQNQLDQATQIAQQLYAMQDERARGQYITNIKHQSPALHALVTAKLDDIRQEAAAQGGAMIQQQSGVMGAPAALPAPGMGMM